MTDAIRTAIFDIETDGLLDQLSRVHLLIIRDLERGLRYVFRQNDDENTITEGVALLEEADILVGHNIIAFDIPALERLYDFKPVGLIRDTLPLCRMIFSTVKDRDFRLWEKGKLEGKLIGSHTLEAWGCRLGMSKGDYKKEMEEKGLDPWAQWSPEMEDYAITDVDVSTLLWRKCLQELSTGWSDESVTLEHSIHYLMSVQEQNGIYFDIAAGEKLAEELGAEADRLSALATEHYGAWYAPAKKKICAPLWDDPEGMNKSKVNGRPDPSQGEDDSRKTWAVVESVKKTIIYKDPLRASRYEGAVYCPIVRKEFNPNSRPQIIDRFSTVYNWTPHDFTETGRPEISDEVLRNLVGHIPMAEELAEVFYYKKRLGALATGPQAWLKKVDDAGLIHHYCNTGGTISRRASHAFPNLGQVPKVKSKKGVQPDGSKKTTVLLGRDGDHGYECRSLFYVPKRRLIRLLDDTVLSTDWAMVGADLSGIELRCLAAAATPFDNGYLCQVILDGDIHEVNREAAGLPDRDKSKTFVYAYCYGAGDAKLGSIVAPLASELEQARIGAELRERFEAKLPGIRGVTKQVQKEARRGFLWSLDGGKLIVRSKHSALNLKLQSDGAIIAKKWALMNEEMLLDHGLEHSWNGDFTQLLWIHDEIQEACRVEHIDLLKRTAVEAARLAGEHFNFACPVAAEAKHGHNWAETH